MKVHLVSVHRLPICGIQKTKHVRTLLLPDPNDAVDEIIGIGHDETMVDKDDDTTLARLETGTEEQGVVRGVASDVSRGKKRARVSLDDFFVTAPASESSKTKKTKTARTDAPVRTF